MAEARVECQTFLLLLTIVPASIVGDWFLISWIVFGRDAFRLETFKAHVSALNSTHGRQGWG